MEGGKFYRGRRYILYSKLLCPLGPKPDQAVIQMQQAINLLDIVPIGTGAQVPEFQP